MSKLPSGRRAGPSVIGSGQRRLIALQQQVANGQRLLVWFRRYLPEMPGRLRP